MWNKHWPVNELLCHTGAHIAVIPHSFFIQDLQQHPHTTNSSIMSFLSMVTFLAVPDITQFNLACIPKACLLVCAKTLSTIALSDKVVSLTLCCQTASYIISSPSLGHVMPLTGDGCLPTKDGWVMAPILTSRRGKITRHSQSVCCRPEQMQRGRGSSRVPSEEGMCTIEREQYAILSSFSTSTHIHLCDLYLFGTF